MATQDKDNEERGFRVIDRRGQERETPEEAASPRAEDAAPKATAPEEPAAPEKPAEGAPKADASESAGVGAAPSFAGPEGFSQFVLSLATSAYMQMGMIPGPDGKSMEKNLPMAKQSIDILGMLSDKTKGNLNQQEEQLMTQVLSELRMRYVDAKKAS